VGTGEKGGASYHMAFCGQPLLVSLSLSLCTLLTLTPLL
jgi:hypothetical protein